MQKPLIAFLMALIAISIIVNFAACAKAETFGFDPLWSNTAYKTTNGNLITVNSAGWQTFYPKFNGTALMNITIWLYETGSCVGNYTMRLYNTTGTPNLGSQPSQALEASTTVINPTAISAGVLTPVTFDFSGETLLYTETLYAWVYYEVNETTADSTNYAAIPYHNYQYSNSGDFYLGDCGVGSLDAWSASSDFYTYFFRVGCVGGTYTEWIGGNTYFYDDVLTYDLADITIQSQPTDLMFYSLLILTFVCIGLMLKSGIPVLNFTFGVMTLGMAAYSLQNSTIVFFGYIQMFAILMASLCMLSGYRSYRNE